MTDTDPRQEKLTPEEFDGQIAELPDREALSLVNLGLPTGTPIAPVDPQEGPPPHVPPPGYQE
jgi:hypothetical protein